MPNSGLPAHSPRLPMSLAPTCCLSARLQTAMIGMVPHRTLMVDAGFQYQGQMCQSDILMLQCTLYKPRGQNIVSFTTTLSIINSTLLHNETQIHWPHAMCLFWPVCIYVCVYVSHFTMVYLYVCVPVYCVCLFYLLFVCIFIFVYIRISCDYCYHYIFLACAFFFCICGCCMDISVCVWIMGCPFWCMSLLVQLCVCCVSASVCLLCVSASVCLLRVSPSVCLLCVSASVCLLCVSASVCLLCVCICVSVACVWRWSPVPLCVNLCSICVCLNLGMCLCFFIHVCMSTCVRVYLYISVLCGGVCIYIYVCVSVCVCVSGVPFPSAGQWHLLAVWLLPSGLLLAVMWPGEWPVPVSLGSDWSPVQYVWQPLRRGHTDRLWRWDTLSHGHLSPPSLSLSLFLTQTWQMTRTSS